MLRERLWVSMWVEKAVCSRGLSRAWEAFIKMLMELPSWHISTGQDPSPLPFFSASICLPQSSVSPPHTTACLGIQPHLYIPLPRRSHSLSDLCCQNPSYILPRVTKLRDASDKGGNPGTGIRRITTLAVCLSPIFMLVGSQTVTPTSHEGCYDFFSTNTVSWSLVSRTLPTLLPLSRLSPQTARRTAQCSLSSLWKQQQQKESGRKTSHFTYKCLDLLNFHERHWMHCPNNFLFSHPFEYKSV